MALSRLAGGRVEVGQLSETIDVLTDTPQPQSILTLTQTLGLATAITDGPHGFQDGDYVRLENVTPAGYRGEHAIQYVDAITFAFVVDPATFSPGVPDSTGPIRVTFVTDAQGGPGQGWRVYATLPAAVRPISGNETLGGAAALTSIVRYDIEIRYRGDLSPQMRLRWREYGQTPGRLLQIYTVRPHPEGLRARVLLECGEVVS